MEGEGIVRIATDNPAKVRARDDSGTNPISPRVVLIGHLAEAVRDAAAVGDLEAARIASDALVRLLGVNLGQSAEVLNLAQERERRGSS